MLFCCNSTYHPNSRCIGCIYDTGASFTGSIPVSYTFSFLFIMPIDVVFFSPIPRSGTTQIVTHMTMTTLGVTFLKWAKHPSALTLNLKAVVFLLWNGMKTIFQFVSGCLLFFFSMLCLPSFFCRVILSRSDTPWCHDRYTKPNIMGNSICEAYEHEVRYTKVLCEPFYCFWWAFRSLRCSV